MKESIKNKKKLNTKKLIDNKGLNPINKFFEYRETEKQKYFKFMNISYRFIYFKIKLNLKIKNGFCIQESKNNKFIPNRIK